MRAFVAFLLVLPFFAYADSDGYFCSARGYFAFELMSPSGTKRIIHVHPLDDSDRAFEAKTIEIDYFQPHGLKCSSGKIEILSWDDIYTIELSEKFIPKTVSKAALPAGTTANGLQKDFAQENLGRWARESKRIFLVSTGTKYNYALEIRVTSKSVKSGLEHVTETSLVKSDLKGKVTRKSILQSSKFLETGD